jgi:ENTS family enterobactin (siderophore) exporter
VAAIGSQFTTMAVALQIYALTRSTFMVGLLGVFILVPLVVMGLYGGSIADRYDRRKVALVASSVMWVATGGLALSAWLQADSVWLLYGLTVIYSAAAAVNDPTRGAIVPRLVDRTLLPAANALFASMWTIAMMVGPVLGAVLVAGFGYKIAYTIDVITFTAAFYSVWRLPSVLPEQAVGGGAGPTRVWRSVIDGFRFLGRRPNVRMTFFIDLAAMVLAQPIALYPAVAQEMIGGGEATAGWLAGFVALGSVVALIFSGPLGRVRRQGRVIIWMVAGWGLGIFGFGVVLVCVGRTSPDAVILWALLASGVCLAFAGACDAVSSVYRNPILQVATPDELRGRLQGVFIVTVAGGPNLGRVLSGGLSRGLSAISPLALGLTPLIGGLACIGATVGLTRLTPEFLRYDAENPTP